MEENNNVLTGGIDSLRTFQELVTRNVTAKNQVDYLASEEKKLERELNLNKKNLKDNIDSMIKKRRLEVAGQYKDEMDKEEGKLKKIKDKRGKAKQKGVKERIVDETSELCNQNKELKGNIRTELKGERLPAFCGTHFYFALFNTKGAGEVFICIIMLFLVCLLLPGGIYLLLPVDHNKKVLSGIVLAVVYFVMILLAVGLYVLIYNKTRKKHEDCIKNIRQLRDRITGNNRQIRKITKSIRKDKNEDMYELGDYDDKIRQIEAEIQRINAEKEAALLNFDDNIKPDIISEMESKELPRINEIEKNYNETVSHKEQMEAVLKETSLKISSEYESYIGREFTSGEKIEALIKIMEGGQAETVSQAIDIYRAGVS